MMFVKSCCTSRTAMKAEVGATVSPAPLGANLPNRFRAGPRVFDEFRRRVGQYVPAIPRIKQERDPDKVSRTAGFLS